MEIFRINFKESSVNNVKLLIKIHNQIVSDIIPTFISYIDFFLRKAQSFETFFFYFNF